MVDSPIGCGSALVGILPGSDGILPKHVDKLQNSDGIAPGYDGIAPGCDGIAPGYDGIAPGCDGIAPGYDGVAPGYDGIAPGYDGVAHGYDGILPKRVDKRQNSVGILPERVDTPQNSVDILPSKIDELPESVVSHAARAAIFPSHMGSPPRKSLPLAQKTRWTPALLEAIAAGERSVLAETLGPRTPDAALLAAEQAALRVDALLESAQKTDPPEGPIACREGCASCCYAKVLATAPEVLRIARHLQSTLAPEDLTALVSKIKESAEAARGLDRNERLEARIPCPLLVDDRCSVHPQRPLLCRGWSSLDRGACERHLETPESPSAPTWAVGYELASAVLAGLSTASADKGLDGALLELIAALQIALSRPNAAERWAKGYAVFATARQSSTRR